MNMIQNTTARAAAIAAIEGAHTKARKTSRGLSPMRGALCFVTAQRRLTLVGGGHSIKLVSADHDTPFAFDRLCFFGATGVICHEEAITPEMSDWFSAQIVRA